MLFIRIAGSARRLPCAVDMHHASATSTLSSDQAGWRTVRFATYAERTEAAERVTQPGSDYSIVLIRRGRCQLDSFVDGRWQRALYRAGDLRMMAPGADSLLCWRGAHQRLHLEISAEQVAHAMTTIPSQGNRSLVLPNLVRSQDSVIASVMTSLERAVFERTPEICAQAAVQFLVVHLLTRCTAGTTPSEPAENASPVALVENYMRARLAERVSLKDLGRVANRSVFQLISLFKAHRGQTPVARLTQLRMERAGELLRQGRKSVMEISLDCGYADPAHFATAFKRVVGSSPSQYRTSRLGH
jgi:AraC family transcriptional regulator